MKVQFYFWNSSNRARAKEKKAYALYEKDEGTRKKNLSVFSLSGGRVVSLKQT